ncbi:hypothetical protein BM536_031990 [Streptomyces phaeoluteigriseus]|uniref:Uncharacterized protein n=1 Tax=Streptomyces phaeoluteigriseus TaxID=114686 RepID=A0A1V6MK90_9ACTN|nr:hypothetical protein [Streptomyces phaeoluteigriseus]OQD52733.1 hypothetical protein BM536_031990 [Streptomyces phaeoluteigriseus]
MGSQDTHRRPDLYGAVGNALTEQRQKADEAARPERERIEQQAAADAKLMGTPAWVALGGLRKARATQYATRPVTGDDATAQTVVQLAQGQAQGGGDDAA